jgi:hypothetical protein
MIKDLLRQPTKLYANWMGWFKASGGKHAAGVCQSDDPETVRKQIKMAQALGVDGFVVDWYGPDDQPTHEATKILAELCKYEGFEFSIMLDAGIYKWKSTDPAVRSQVLQDAVNWVMQNFVTRPGYSVISGRPLLWEFGWRHDAFSAPPTFGNALLLSQDSLIAPYAGGTFAWVNGFPPGDPMSYVKSYLARTDAVQVPCIFWGFDDHDPKSPANSIWSGPARFISPQFGDTWTGCIDAINATGKTYPAIQICTWNDYDERTCIEPFAKALTGMRLL